MQRQIGVSVLPRRRKILVGPGKAPSNGAVMFCLRLNERARIAVIRLACHFSQCANAFFRFFYSGRDAYGPANLSIIAVNQLVQVETGLQHHRRIEGEIRWSNAS